MSDLTLQKWDCVIVDWVNCLEIAKRIQNINALKSGEFFKALLDILQPDLHTSLGEFLRTYYPSFELGGDGKPANFTDAELTAVASMLLHFMSIHDRREELISPMCHKLNGGVQTFIKHFLEHFGQETKAAEFNDVVRKAIEGEAAFVCGTPKKVMEWNSSGESPFVHNSPLLEYFKTPAAKTAKMQEKDREIRRLQQELQLERDEREDLNAEIKEQKKRVQKISLEVHEKSLTISNLSARLAELEEQPPTNKPREVIEIEKLLRSELADAQQYICELQSEHGELSLRKEEISRKLSKSEESTCVWQERAVQFESKLDEALARYKAQAEELTSLQINYNELSTLLDELRANKTHNNTLELDNSVSTVNVEPKSSEETLADTVVEIQLKECQLEMQELQTKLYDEIQHSSTVDKQLQATLRDLEECRKSFNGLEAMKYDVDVTLDKYILTNEKLETKINKLAKDFGEMGDKNKKLQDSLTASVEESQKLEDELVDVKGQLEDANNNHQQLGVKNEELLKQMLVLQQSEDSLMNTNATIIQQVEEFSRGNLLMGEELVTLKLHLSEREDAAQKNDELITSLLNDLGVIERARDDFEEKLATKNEMFDVLEEESRSLQAKYEEAVEAFNSTDFNLQALQRQIKETDCKFQDNIDRLEELITGSIEGSKMDKFERVGLLLEKLDSKQMSFEGSIENLKTLNCKLEEQFELLKKEDLTRQSYLEKVQKLLEQSQETVHNFEGDIKEKVGQISVLEESVKSLNATVQELEKLKDVICQRETENVELKTLYVREQGTRADLDNQLEVVQAEFTLLKEEFSNKSNELENMEHLKDELKTRVTTLEKQNYDGRLKFEALEHQNDSLQNKYEMLQDELFQVESENSSMQDNLDTMQTTNSYLLQQLDNLRVGIEEQTRHNEELLRKCEDVEAEKQLLTEHCQQDIEQLQRTIEELQNAKESLLEDVESGKVQIENLSLEYNGLQSKFEIVQFELSQVERDNSTLQEDVDNLQTTNTELSQQLDELRISIDEQTKQNDDLLVKCEALETEKLGIQKEYEKQQDFMATSINDLKKIKESLLQDIEDGKLAAVEQAREYEELENKYDALQKELFTSNSDISSLKEDVDILQITKSDLLTKLDEIEVEKKGFKVQIGSLTDELSYAKGENDYSKRTIEELMVELDSQLLKHKNKESELSLAKEEFSNKDFDNMQTINELNSKVTTLSKIKQNLESDLQLAKDETALKEREFVELDKSRNKIEKQLRKTISQHEKKIELMGLTIDNLENKLRDLTAEKEMVELRFADETETVVALTAEKGKLAGELMQTKNELTALMQRLREKETDCDNKDDVIEKNTVELLSLKLDIEMKSNELSTCKSNLQGLQEEKNAAIKSASALKLDLDKLSNKHTTTVEELEVITDMKNSLTGKMDNFRDNMQAVFNHFEIKKKNMKQSLEELKKYKGTKEEEITQLNLQLVEVRADVERLKEESHSVKKELQLLIDSKTKDVDNLELEIDKLKTTEIGCLQEIAILKEELNYTIDKYTEALACEKEQKAENDLQIQNLTESLHEMLEKFNALDKEHKELTNAMEYNKKSYDELNTDKDCLELEIVRLKDVYEADAKNCKGEFENELKTLKKLEGTLKENVEDLKALLERSTEEGSTVVRELEDAKSHLRIIQNEKSELINKLDDLELCNTGLRKEYDSLKIAKEKYMKESKHKLIEKQEELQREKKAHEATIEQKEKEVGKLKKEVGKHLERLRREEDTHKKLIEKNKKEMQELHTSIANFLQNIETLTKEKDTLTKKIKKQEVEHEEMLVFCKQQDKTIEEHVTKIQNLQISHDVLEAGKAKMEKIQSDLQERLAKLQTQMNDEKLKFEVSRNTLQAQLDKAHAQIRDGERAIKDKCAEIKSLNEEFDSVQSILTNMTKKMETTSRQLSVIHEDYQGKLKSERKSFDELKEQYCTTLREMEYMGGLNDGLSAELAEARRDRQDAEMSVAEKEELIAELQQKYASVASEIGAKDASIASLQAELADRMGKLADAAGARHALEDERRRAEAQLAQVEAQREELIETQACALRAVEENLLRTEGEVREVVARLEETRCGRGEIERLLEAERETRQFLERRVVDLEAQVFEATSIGDKLTCTIKQIAGLVQDKREPMDVEELDDVIMETERRLIVVFGKLRDLEGIKEGAEQDKENAQRALTQMDKCNQQLNEDKAKLLESYEKLHEEKAALLQNSKSLENMKMQFETLRNQQNMSTLLEEKMQLLEANNKQQHQLFCGFLQKSRATIKVIETIVSDRNQLEQVVCNLRDQYTTLQIKSVHVTEDSHKLHYEQKCALEIIIDDIHKQFRRLSKMIYNLNLKCHQVVEKTMSAIIENKTPDCPSLFKELSVEEITEKLEDLKDNANNTQVQLEQFFVSIEALTVKDEKTRVLKENMQPVKQQPKEDEWRKKYLSVKQKLTLVENAKNNFEKKIKQLREENKKLSTEEVKIELKQEVRVKDEVVQVENKSVENNDVHYKNLLQEYIQLKQQNQDDVALWTEKCRKLEVQLSHLHQNKMADDDDLQNELASLKGSYREVKVAYSKLQLDYSALEQLLTEKTEQVSTLSTTKESYATLGEENTKLKSEIDTQKYKRQRDREQFMQHVKKLDAELAEKVTEVRGEYDLKLEKMKERIVSKYREQVDENETHRYSKMAALKDENEHYRTTVGKLKDELGKAQAKNEILDSEKQYVMQQLKIARLRGDEAEFHDFKEPTVLSRRASSHSLHSDLRSAFIEERRSTFSLPRNVQAGPQGQMDVIEEVRYRRRTSNVAPQPTELQMEDEGDMFNNKYLHDLKEGRPSIGTTGRESSSRLSEFAYRNSLCPPHLKSSYPAETQFLDHRQFKEDDLKSGNIEFMDDTMKTQLLPTEKHKKKDAGTTSYKRPGPPTPSKNGGRLSLQGNERVLRENSAEQKRVNPPNTLRSLFSSSSKKVAACNGENAGAASPKKRPSLNIFRR